MRQIFFLIFVLVAGWLFSPCGSATAEERLIAVIMADSQPRYQEVHSAFVQRSDTFCGQDCKLYVQTPNADMMSLRNAVRKAVALNADLIVTYGPMASLAAESEIPPIPILFADVYDPVGLGLVSATSLVGRNITGVRGDAPIQGLLKYFTETVVVSRLGVLYDIKSPEALLQKSILEASCKRKGIEVIAVGVGNNKNDHQSSLEDLPKDIEGIFVASSEHHESQLAFVLDQTSAKRIPVITQRAKAAEMGAFMVLETSAAEQGEKLAEMAGELFSGKKIEQMPMYRPREVAFVINLKAAKQYGIEIPFQTLSVASRIIR